MNKKSNKRIIGSYEMAEGSGIRPPKKNCQKTESGVPSITMRKIPPSSPLQPPTKPSGRGSRKK